MGFIKYFGGNACSRKDARKVKKKLLYFLVHMWSRDSVEGIATDLRSGKPGNSGSNIGRDQKFVIISPVCYLLVTKGSLSG